MEETYLWGGPYKTNLRFVTVTLESGKLWANLRRDKTDKFYVDGTSVNEDEVTQFSQLRGKMVKHKHYGCVGELSLYMTTDTPAPLLTPKKDRLNEFVFVKWKSFGEKNLLLHGWVNVNDVEFLTN